MTLRICESFKVYLIIIIVQYIYFFIYKRTFRNGPDWLQCHYDVLKHYSLTLKYSHHSNFFYVLFSGIKKSENTLILIFNGSINTLYSWQVTVNKSTINFSTQSLTFWSEFCTPQIGLVLINNRWNKYSILFLNTTKFSKLRGAKGLH